MAEHLSEDDVAPEPVAQFAAWFADARAALGDDADAIVVASADADGAPSARVVLLRGFDERGFCFFTNYESRKGTELDANPRAAVVCHWPALHRQVRISGRVERVSDAESDAYWVHRPVPSQLGAWASRQSRPVVDRAALEDAVADVTRRFGDDPVARPPFWGGYRVVPDEVEFWLHRDDRLHDRVRYRRVEPGGVEPGGVPSGWVVERLQP